MAPTDASSLKNLDTIIQSSVSLLQQLQVALAEIHRSPTAPPAPSSPSTSNSHLRSSTAIDALALAKDSASLIRAHSTKLSLLIVNEPFTPNAIITVVRDLAGGPIPGLAASLEECRADKYTAVIRRELAWRCRSVLVELTSLLQKVPQNGQALSSAGEGFGSDGKGSIALTGVLWSACDQVIELTNLGVAGFFANKVGEWRDTLKDVMEELKEWGEEEAESDDDDGEDEDEDDAVNALADELRDSHISTQDMLDDLMSHRTIPKSDPDAIRPRLETSLKRLRLVTLLYQAIIKRRIKKLPSIPPSADSSQSVAEIPQRLDEAAGVLRVLPDRFGDLACAFYELQSDEIDSLIDQCFLDAFAASELLAQAWGGGRDEFTDWAEKFQAQIKQE
ncbi:hypothetical protein ACRE_051490 [Hapsidospora chrysogenum ATCC 11550]|uniref:Cyclin-D1-binding protein 1-like N-terminal domain-containing protein n=1 Tax=Hapsidospora chrysogenum (strain ATCC 11550 / CBS 779.69 / DSM 880 / IAM 14645 / JCM 23072 / IMI 49137) TaxID=857340 RepID=A0A086T3Z9_HAPC1|nr:hypothetical protein ACRE_051490 [Hapsidospora chrysogenum ATCC 11550]